MAEAARKGYDQVMEHLGRSLELVVEQGGYDQQMARCVLMEAASLHGAQLVPGEEQAHMKRAVSNLKLAAKAAAKRKALVETASGLDPSNGPVANLPEWVTTELQEVAAAQFKGKKGVDGEEDEEPPEASSSLNSLVYLMLSLLRERELRLFEDDELSVRTGELHKAMAEGVPAYSTECHVALTREQLVEEAEPEAGEVVGQWYKPTDVRGASARTNLLLVLGQAGRTIPATEEGEEASAPPGWVLMSKEVEGGGLWEAEQEIVQVTQMDGEEGGEKGVATAEWDVQVHPKLGPIEVQGEGAQNARMEARAAAGRASNAAAMMVLGVSTDKAEEGGGGEEVSVDTIASLGSLLSTGGVAAVDAPLCSALYSWLAAP